MPKVMVEKEETSPGNHVAAMTMCNLANLNIVNASILAQLQSACQELASHEKLRAVILTGGPTAFGKQAPFIRGADVAEMHRLSSADEARAFILTIRQICQALRDLPVPVIAAVHGFSLGAGLEMMAACDLRVATKASVFWDARGQSRRTVSRQGCITAGLDWGWDERGGCCIWLRMSPRLGQSGEGLVGQVAEDEAELNTVVESWVEKLVAMGPKAIRSQKKLMQMWEGTSVDEGIQAGVDAFAEAFADRGAEPRELMGRFVNGKRGELEMIFGYRGSRPV